MKTKREIQLEKLVETWRDKYVYLLKKRRNYKQHLDSVKVDAGSIVTGYVVLLPDILYYFDNISK